jgi:hypothetical protein
VVSNAQLTNEGTYRVRAENANGSVTSDPVDLRILINPAVLIPPLNQSAVAGGNATFSLVITGHPPPFGYLLRKGSTIVTNYNSDEPIAFFTLFNVQSNNAGTYRLVVTNEANPSPGLTLDPVTLTILADNDHDGLPDEWEAGHDLGTNNAADAQFDSDLDGQTNWQEYLAGTNPRDSQSLHKLARIFLAAQEAAAVVEFNAVSNKTYTLQYRGSATTGAWARLADFVALPTNRLVSITNSLHGTEARYYRLLTPRAP